METWRITPTPNWKEMINVAEPTNTPDLDFYKPDRAESYSITKLNENWDKTQEAFVAQAAALTETQDALEEVTKDLATKFVDITDEEIEAITG